MPEEISTVHCSACNALLKMFAISSEDHDLLKEVGYCEEDCDNKHPWQENCRVCAKVRADQWLAARLQDAAGLGIIHVPDASDIKFEPEWLEKVCDLVWGKK